MGTCCYAWMKALSSFLALTMPENDFGGVIECNTYLEAILHLCMLFGMKALSSFLALTIPQNAFEAVLDCNAYLGAILHLYMLLCMVEGPKFVFSSNYA